MIRQKDGGQVGEIPFPSWRETRTLATNLVRQGTISQYPPEADPVKRDKILDKLCGRGGMQEHILRLSDIV
ncbi:MAG: hypothetical protein ACE5H0_06440 [Bacteroidota bacterium]